MNAITLTPDSLALFKDLARDSFNWRGMPLLNGNVGTDAAARGNLTDLKRKGLIKTDVTRDRVNGLISIDTWVLFTEKGAALAAELGIADVEVLA